MKPFGYEEIQKKTHNPEFLEAVKMGEGGRRTEGGGRKTEGGKPRTKGRGQKAEGRRQRAKPENSNSQIFKFSNSQITPNY